MDLRVDKGVLLLHRETDGECLQGRMPAGRGAGQPGCVAGRGGSHGHDPKAEPAG